MQQVSSPSNNCEPVSWILQEILRKLSSTLLLNLNICTKSYPVSLGWLNLHHYFIMRGMKVSSLVEYSIIIADEIKRSLVISLLLLWHIDEEEGWSIWGGDHTEKCEEEGYWAKQSGFICRQTTAIHQNNTVALKWSCFLWPSSTQTRFKRGNRFTHLTNLKISPVQQTQMEFFTNRLWDHFNPCGAQQMLSAELEDSASRLIVYPEQNAQGYSVWQWHLAHVIPAMSANWKPWTAAGNAARNKNEQAAPASSCSLTDQCYLAVNRSPAGVCCVLCALAW